MKMQQRILSFFLTTLLMTSLLMTPKQAKADEMKTFLLSCAYGTMIGAAVGLATVAISDDPSSHTQNIAKGASLGLYAGIGYGLYLNYGRSKSTSQDFTLEKSSPVWLQADTNQGHVDGASIHWVPGSF